MRKLTTCLALMMMGSASAAFADPLLALSIPQESRWVIHVDVDAARASPLWEVGRSRFMEQIAPQVEKLETVTGMSLPQDLHDVTMYGAAYDESATCVLIHGKMDQKRTTGLLKLDPEFRTEDYHGHEILIWRDKAHDRLMYGIFAGGDTAIIGTSEKVVMQAVDTLDGKSPALKADSPLAHAGAGGAPGVGRPIVWVAGEDLSELPRAQKAQSPLLEQVEAASISLTSTIDILNAQAKLTTKTPKAAEQMMKMAEGVQAMVALAESDEHAPPQARVISNVLRGLTLSKEGKTVNGDWLIHVDKIAALIDIAQQQQAGHVSTNNTSQPAPTTDKKQ